MISDNTFEEQYEYEIETDKGETRSIELIQCDEDGDTSQITQTMNYETNRELIDLQKELMRTEFEQKQKCLLAKHQLEMSILKTELAHKTLEHQKRMELLEKQEKH